MLNNWLKNSQWLNLSQLFKQNCLLCAALEGNHDGLCQACLNELPFSPSTSCPQCGLGSNGLICGSCLNAAPSFDTTRAALIYSFPIDAMMRSYKYGNYAHLSHTFGQLLAEKVDLESIDLIIPMPMHPARIKERGFNQALEIAKVLHKKLREHPSPSQGEGSGGGQMQQIALDIHSVKRTKLTPPQASLPLKDRVKNIKGAFSVNGDLTGKRIALVDDVMTSGASLNELAKTLKTAGAAHVECWVVARTLPKR